jgi:hypothetical protein
MPNEYLSGVGQPTYLSDPNNADRGDSNLLRTLQTVTVLKRSYQPALTTATEASPWRGPRANSQARWAQSNFTGAPTAANATYFPRDAEVEARHPRCKAPENFALDTDCSVPRQVLMLTCLGSFCRWVGPPATNCPENTKTPKNLPRSALSASVQLPDTCGGQLHSMGALSESVIWVENMKRASSHINLRPGS